jgi:hypothetical protein
MADPVYTWTPNVSRTVIPNGYYRFPVVVPGTTTDDILFTLLESKSWEVRSIGVPPPELSEAVLRVAMAGLQAPKAFWIHATWRGNNAVIPAIDGAIYYGPLETLIEEKPQIQDKPDHPIALAILGCAIAFTGAWFIYTRSNLTRI